LLTELDFAFFIGKLCQINLKLKILIRNRYSWCIKNPCGLTVVLIQPSVIMFWFLMFALYKEYEPIQLIIVKDFNLMFVVGDEEVEQINVDVLLLLLGKGDGVKVELDHEAEQ
jgi:hypothetical protein